jgi:pyruvate formate lyase activating enzyme
VDFLLEARSIARASGLRYAYIGNVRGLADAETTFCPNCKKAIIERDVFRVTRMDLDAGKCKFCNTKIAGVWTA